MARYFLCGLFWVGVAAVLSTLPSTSHADQRSEIENAGLHATIAADSVDIADVRSHLHHALNCLVGPHGSGFDAKEINPCAHSGNGAIPDTRNAATKAKLESSAAKAREGIATNDIVKAKRAAYQCISLLQGL